MYTFYVQIVTYGSMFFLFKNSRIFIDEGKKSEMHIANPKIHEFSMKFLLCDHNPKERIPLANFIAPAFDSDTHIQNDPSVSEIKIRTVRIECNLNSDRPRAIGAYLWAIDVYRK